MINISNLLPLWPDTLKNSDPFFLGQATILEAIKQWNEKRTSISQCISYLSERLQLISHPGRVKLAVKRFNNDPNSITINPEGFFYASRPEKIFPFSIAWDVYILSAKTTMSYCGGCVYRETANYDHDNPIESSLKCSLVKNTSFANHTKKPYDTCLFQTIKEMQLKEVISAYKLTIKKQTVEMSSISEKINALSLLIKSTPKRPIPPWLRGEDYFKERESVHVYVGSLKDYLPEYQNSHFIPCIIIKNNLLEVLFQQKVCTKDNCLCGYGGYLSPKEWSVINKEDREVLLADSVYAKYWAEMASKDDESIDSEKFLAALEKLRDEK